MQKGTYLKYEEGDVVPVESKRPPYPPFLEDSEDEPFFKTYKDIVREDTKKDVGDVTAHNQSQSRFNFNGVISRLFWFILLGVLIYSSIPIFQYFLNETPALIKQNGKQLEQKITQVTEGTEEVVKQVEREVKKIEDVAGDISEKNANSPPKLSPPSSSSPTESHTLSENDWLKLISQNQNAKQEQVKKIQKLTHEYLTGNLSFSRYRLEVKGISTTAKRHQVQLHKMLQNYDTSQVKDTLNVLIAEFSHLEEWSISLSSVPENKLIPVYNDGANKQNELTQVYIQAFSSLLSNFGRSYTIQDGVIIY